MATAYITVQDMVDEFGNDELVRLTDRSRSGALDSALVLREIEAVSEQINTACRRRYRIPLDPVDPEIASICKILVWWNLSKHLATDRAKEMHDDAIRRLERIANGQYQLSSAPAPTDQPASSAIAGGSKRPVFDARLWAKAPENPPWV